VEVAVAATDGPIAALMRAALALPIIAVPAQAGAAEVGEIGFSVLGYREQRHLMKITEPILWVTVPFWDTWEIRASGAIDIITGASPSIVTNSSGTAVQSITGASISDRRNTGDLKVTKRIGEYAVSLSRTVSKEEDYLSHAWGAEVKVDLANRNTTLVAGFGKSNDRVRSADDPQLDERRDTKEYLLGVTQVLSQRAIVQSTLAWSRGVGWYNDPYKTTVTFYPDLDVPLLATDLRPPGRHSLAWLTRYRLHFPASRATLEADYRFFRDDWGIRAHTFEVAWNQGAGERWSLRPALRYYTQTAADFYSTTVARPAEQFISSDQRVAAFGGLSPSFRTTWRGDTYTVEGTVGYYRNSRSLKLGGGATPDFVTLTAAYVLFSISRPF
jgi:uncharacterized protein DUF3570